MRAPRTGALKCTRRSRAPLPSRLAGHLGARPRGGALRTDAPLASSTRVPSGPQARTEFHISHDPDVAAQLRTRQKK